MQINLAHEVELNEETTLIVIRFNGYRRLNIYLLTHFKQKEKPGIDARLFCFSTIFEIERVKNRSQWRDPLKRCGTGMPLGSLWIDFFESPCQ
jgi:hypothetical protein